MIYQWSYSRLSTFEKCPKQAEFRYIKKIQEPSVPAMERGQKIHKLCEEHIRGNFEEIPKEIKDFEEAFTMLRELYVKGHVLCEGDWAFTKEWEKTGWFDQDTWGRAKVDAFVYDENNPEKARVIDFKTGRYDGNQETHKEQCELYAAIALKRYPDLQEIETEMWYLDHGKIDRYIYSRDNINAQRKRIEDRAIAMTDATEFPAKPYKFKCKWCYFGKEGLCKDAIMT